MKLTSQMPSSASLNIVAGLPRYAEIPANVRHGLAIQQAGHKAKALFHHRTRFPPHQHLPPAKGEKCYPCVRYGISPISRAAHIKLGTPKPAVFALEAATSVRSSTLLEPMMRSSFASTSTRWASARRW